MAGLLRRFRQFPTVDDYVFVGDTALMEKDKMPPFRLPVSALSAPHIPHFRPV
jgi:hypothetical protein